MNFLFQEFPLSWLFFYRTKELTSIEYEEIAEETLQSLSDKFDLIGDKVECDPDYDVSYGVSFINKWKVGIVWDGIQAFVNYCIFGL